MRELIVRVLDIQCLDAVKDAQYLAVRQVDLQRVGTRHILQLADHGRHIVTENVELQQVFIDLVIVKMRRDDVCRRVVRRMLYRTKLINLVVVRTDNDSARVLPGRPFHARTMLRQTLFFIFVDRNIAFLKELRDITVSGLFGDRTDRSRLKHILFTENSPDIAVRHRLIFPRKVQVDIRLLIALEPKEGRERDRIAIPLHRRTAVRTVQRRHIYAAVVLLHITPDDLFAVWTKIMRVKGIDLRNARHRRRER